MSPDGPHSRVRNLLILFIAGLVLSGLTAFPLVWEAGVLRDIAGSGTAIGARIPLLAGWIDRVNVGLAETGSKYPFIAYGTDWLAFAHIVIAIAFWGPLKDPVRNIWVIEFGMIACVLVIPLALVCGPIRGIPPMWRVIDCSFGVLGIIPLALAKHYVSAHLLDLENRGQRAIAR
jgi:hypothetical protein